MTNPYSGIDEERDNSVYEEAQGLIDGAYDIVMIFDATTPAQEKWKEEWLRKAREHGANIL